MTAQKAVRINSPLAKERAPKQPKAMIRRPPARPSRPSVRLTALEVARMTRMKSGMYHQPSMISPTPGMWIWS